MQGRFFFNFRICAHVWCWINRLSQCLICYIRLLCMVIATIGRIRNVRGGIYVTISKLLRIRPRMIFKMTGTVLKVRQFLLSLICALVSCHTKLALLGKLKRDIAKVLCGFREIVLKRSNLISVAGSSLNFFVGRSRCIGCATALRRARWGKKGPSIRSTASAATPSAASTEGTSVRIRRVIYRLFCFANSIGFGDGQI